MYALQYGNTVASFKWWDAVDTVLSQARVEYLKGREKYDSFFETVATHFSCSIGEAKAGVIKTPFLSLPLEFHFEKEAALLKLITQHASTEEVLRESASSAAQDMLKKESEWIRQEKNPFKNFLKRGKNPSLKDLQEARAYIEDYFSDSENCAQITLLAQ